MIFTEISGLKNYKGISGNLDTAIDYLMSKGTNALVPGKNVIDGDKVYVNVFEYDTMPEQKAMFEAHRDYLDIHVLISGTELIGVSDISHYQITETDLKTDYIGGTCAVEQHFEMLPGHALIVWPEDPHMVKIMNGKVSHVQKAVVKVLI